MDRVTSTSPGRLRTLIGRPHRTLPQALRHAFERQGLKIDRVGITPSSDPAGAYVLSASGFHEDGTPFAFASHAFTGDPVERAHAAAADLAKAHTGNPFETVSKPFAKPFHDQGTVTMDDSKTPAIPTATIEPAPAKAGDLTQAAQRFRARKQALQQRLGDFETKADAVMTRSEGFLNKQEAELHDLENEINQLSNE